MKKKLQVKKIIILVSAFFIISSAVFFASDFLSQKRFTPVRAGSGDNVTGYAWSDNIGWVSFNCLNDSSCSFVNYGVNIDRTSGIFSGYAWSDNIGWVSFNRKTCNAGINIGKACQADADCLDGQCREDGLGATGSPPSDPFLSDTSKIAYLDSTGKVSGWAKILSLGDGGWLNFGDSTSGTSFPIPFPSSFPLDFESSSGGYSVSINSANGEFSGWAWNGNDDNSGIGWLSFNCADTSVCSTSDYKVSTFLNSSPTVSNLTAPNWTYANACAGDANQAILRWEFSDSDMGSMPSSYQVIFDDDNDISDPLIDSGKVDAYAAQFPVNSLDYNKTYYWWVKVWDDGGMSSDFVAGPQFTTYKHEMPQVDFTYSPTDPDLNEEVGFSDISTASGGATISSRLWTAANTTISPDATSTNPIMTFRTTGATVVKLKATDSDGYYCELEKTINIGGGLPFWREVKPR